MIPQQNVDQGEANEKLDKPADVATFKALMEGGDKKSEKKEEDSDSKPGSGQRIAKILGDLQKEIEARGKLGGEKEDSKDKKPKDEDKKEDKKDEKKDKESDDGMGELKKFFSGKDGLKRSEAFIKFAKLLTDGQNLGEEKKDDKDEKKGKEPEDKKKV